MDDARDLVRKVLEQGYLMSLATVDESGPWVADVIYVFDENFTIYWLSKDITRHSKAILKNPAVAASITVSNNQGEDNVGLQLSGNVAKIEGDILEIASKHRLKRNKPIPKKPGEILEAGESWYKLTPKIIELIYEPKWGFVKQKISI